MKDVIIVFCTFPTKNDARQIGTLLVKKQLVACVNIIPELESIYEWDGNVQRESEALVMMKTKRECFELLEIKLQELHPYDTPEIIATDVVDGAKNYLKWVKSQTSS